MPMPEGMPTEDVHAAWAKLAQEIRTGCCFSADRGMA